MTEREKYTLLEFIQIFIQLEILEKNITMVGYIRIIDGKPHIEALEVKLN